MPCFLLVWLKYLLSPAEFSVVIITVVAVVIALLILVIGLVCIKR